MPSPSALMRVSRALFRFGFRGGRSTHERLPCALRAKQAFERVSRPYVRVTSCLRAREWRALAKTSDPTQNIAQRRTIATSGRQTKPYEELTMKEKLAWPYTPSELAELGRQTHPLVDVLYMSIFPFLALSRMYVWKPWEPPEGAVMSADMQVMLVPPPKKETTEE